MIAFSGVRSSCDMLARNSDLWRLATSSCWLPPPLQVFFHLLLEPGVGFTEPRRHVVELLGDCLQLITAVDLDALIQGAGGDPRGAGLESPNWRYHPAR